jgi:hypothetical protein
MALEVSKQAVCSTDYIWLKQMSEWLQARKIITPPGSPKRESPPVEPGPSSHNEALNVIDVDDIKSEPDWSDGLELRIGAKRTRSGSPDVIDVDETKPVLDSNGYLQMGDIDDEIICIKHLVCLITHSY